MNIRPFKNVDTDAVIQLWTDCGLVVPQNNPRRDIERKMRVNPELFLIGELDGKIMATCMAGYEGHRGWINYLAVAPSLQRQGYAREIMSRAEQLLAEAGCPKINLQVRTTNLKVIDFYKSIGFTTDHVVGMGKRLEEG
jgi:ribosomal protein S18 acetylase RimI-like enzyme